MLLCFSAVLHPTSKCSSPQLHLHKPPHGLAGSCRLVAWGQVPVVGESKLGWQVRLPLPQPLAQNPGARQSVRCWQVGMQWGEVLALSGWAWCAVLLMQD